MATNSEVRHKAKLDRQDAKRRLELKKQGARGKRDEMLMDINKKYEPQIKKLRDDMVAERKQVWKDFDEGKL